MSVFSDEESALLDRIAIDIELDRLSPLHRVLIICRFAYDIPGDYAGPWPPRYAETGKYAGRRYLGKPLSATRTQHHTAGVLVTWRCLHHPPVTTSSSTHRRAA